MKVKLGSGKSKSAEAEIIVKEWRKRQSHATIGVGRIFASESPGTQNEICSIYDEKGKNVGSIQIKVLLLKLPEPDKLATSDVHEVTTTALGFSHLYRLDVAVDTDLREYLSRSKQSTIVERLPPSLRENHDIERVPSDSEHSQTITHCSDGGSIPGLNSVNSSADSDNWDSAVITPSIGASKRTSLFFREWELGCSNCT